MQQQQLSDSLLLLDTILQKGFEADTFIEGFGEFCRNLLVSKDPKAVSLLEVAEDFPYSLSKVFISLINGLMIKHFSKKITEI